MKADIISVGTELLLGQIANTDAQYISQRLSEIGIGVYFHTAVGDNWERIHKSIEIAASRSDIIILTGGLGPTVDDITNISDSKQCFTRKAMSAFATDSQK